MRRALPALVLGFPALALAGVWMGMDRRLLAFGLALLALARWGGWLGRRHVGLAVAALAGLAWAAWARPQLALKAYPVAVNMGLLAVFSRSLTHGPPVVERLARLRNPDLGDAAVLYTRAVTKAWCLFFAANAGLSLFTAVALSERAWAVYNGAVAYALMGLMFAGEWLLRRRVVSREALRRPPSVGGL